MRLKRQANARKNLDFFIRTFNFEKPFKFLVDPDFLFAILKAGLKLRISLENLLSQYEFNIFLTTCIKKELQALALTPGPRNGEWKGVLALVEAPNNNIKYMSCKHPFSKKCNAHQCIKYTLDPYYSLDPPDVSAKVEVAVDSKPKKAPKQKKANPEHMIMCAQHSELRQECRNIPGIPIIMIQGNILIFETPSDVTKAYSQRIKVTHHHKITMKENIELLQRLAANAPVENVALQSVLENKPIPGSMNVVNSNISSTYSQTTNAQSNKPLIVGKKEKPKSANPLSMKKGKTKQQPTLSYKKLRTLTPNINNGQSNQPTKKNKANPSSKSLNVNADAIVQLPSPQQLLPSTKPKSTQNSQDTNPKKRKNVPQ